MKNLIIQVKSYTIYHQIKFATKKKIFKKFSNKNKNEKKQHGFYNTTLLEELMFGRENTDPEMDTKIHNYKQFNQILLTKQFTIKQIKKTKKYSLGIILQFGNEEEDKKQIILQKFFF